VNFELPEQDDDFEYYGNSSQDESRNIRGRHFLFLICLGVLDYCLICVLNFLGFLIREFHNHS
jgi:hypothetical protein